MGRLILNFFRVVQILLDIAVKESLRDYWHFPKEVDYSLICVLTMHHLEYCQFCITARFCFGTEPHCSCFSAFWMIQWSSYIFVHFPPVLVMSWSLVVVNINWCGVSATKSFCIYQYTTWLKRDIRRIVNHIVFLFKVKFYKSCLYKCNWFVVWLGMTSELPSIKPPSKTWKRCSGSLSFSR